MLDRPKRAQSPIEHLYDAWCPITAPNRSATAANSGDGVRGRPNHDATTGIGASEDETVLAPVEFANPTGAFPVESPAFVFAAAPRQPDEPRGAQLAWANVTSMHTDDER